MKLSHLAIILLLALVIGTAAAYIVNTYLPPGPTPINPLEPHMHP